MCPNDEKVPKLRIGVLQNRRSCSRDCRLAASPQIAQNRPKSALYYVFRFRPRASQELAKVKQINTKIEEVNIKRAPAIWGPIPHMVMRGQKKLIWL